MLASGDLPGYLTDRKYWFSSISQQPNDTPTSGSSKCVVQCREELLISSIFGHLNPSFANDRFRVCPR